MSYFQNAVVVVVVVAAAVVVVVAVVVSRKVKEGDNRFQYILKFRVDIY
jgi:hypothetical protein